MSDFLIQAILGNLLVSTILASIAWLVQSRYQADSLANLLWVIVLIKMITPPLFSIPLFEVGSVATANHRSIPLEQELPVSKQLYPRSTETSPVGGTATFLKTAETKQPAHQLIAYAVQSLLAIWAMVSAVVLVVSAIRIIRFQHILRRNLRPTTPKLERIALLLVAEMKLKRMPQIVESHANVSPFVWWLGGLPQVVIPRTAIDSLNESDLRLVVAHEMAHIKRRDHWVRWLEWSAVLCMWWNPIMWWACRELRATEEIACDALVLELLRTKRHDYASSLLNMAELLTTTAIRPPAVVSAMNSGGNMEKRLTMIIAENHRKIAAWQRALLAAFTICIVPLGLVCAQDYEAVERRLGGAVEAGELSLEQANIMLEALKHSTSGDRDGEKGELEARKQRYMEVARDVEAAVEAGNLSKEEAEKKLIAVRRDIFEEKSADKPSDGDMEARKRRFTEVARDIEAAVEAGKLSKEEAEKKLIAVRREMFEEKSGKQQNDGEMEARKRRYEQLTQLIKAAMEDGALSAEGGEKKLIELKKEIFGGDD